VKRGNFVKILTNSERVIIHHLPMEQKASRFGKSSTIQVRVGPLVVSNSYICRHRYHLLLDENVEPANDYQTHPANVIIVIIQV
jgi:hypothetical protein